MERQQRVSVIGTDNVVNAWKAMNDGYPYYAVYYNRSNKFFQYNKPDMDGAEALLAATLQALEDNGDNAMYYLNIYAEPKPVFPNKDMICSFPFRVNPFSESGIGTVGGVGDTSALAKLLNEWQTKHVELVKEIAELKNADKPLQWYDHVYNILESPGAAQTLVPILQPIIGSVMGILGKITGAPVAPVMPVPGIAGPETEVDQDEKLNMALDRLEKHADLVDMLTRLADFADKNPDQFKLYLNMLK